MEESRLKVELWQLRDRILQQASHIEDLKAQLKHTRRSSDKIPKRRGNKCKIRRAKLVQCELELREARTENERLKAKKVQYQKRLEYMEQRIHRLCQALVEENKEVHNGGAGRNEHEEIAERKRQGKPSFVQRFLVWWFVRCSVSVGVFLSTISVLALYPSSAVSGSKRGSNPLTWRAVTFRQRGFRERYRDPPCSSAEKAQ